MTTTYSIIQFLFPSETIEFSRDQILAANLVEENTPISIEIPVSTLTFKLYVSDNSFSMFSDSSTALIEKLPILAYESIDGDVRLLGKFYLKKWKNTQEHQIEFTAIDIIGVLENTDFDGVFFSDATLVSEALTQILTPINVSFELSDDFVDSSVKGWIPSGNYREALQFLCFAGNAITSTARSENLVINSISIPELFYDAKLKDSEKKNVGIEFLPLISKIELVSHNYTQQDTLETIFEKYLEAGSHKIVFSKPYTGVVVDGPGYTQSVLGTEGGDTLGTEYGDSLEAGGEYNINSNSVYLTISTAGTVTITGYPWLDSQRSFVFNEDGVTEADNKNTILISDATLVNVDNGQDILDNLINYYRQRYIQNVKIFPTVNVQTGDIVLSGTIYNNKILAYVRKMEIDMIGGFLAKTEIHGLAAPAYVPAEENPTRKARTGMATCGADLTRNNSWRNYN
jgi:hypothetical protein